MAHRFALMAFILALLVAACGETGPSSTTLRERTPITTTLSPADLATSTTVAPAEAPAGFFVYKGDGFEMFMPKTWTIAGYGDLDLQAVLDELSANGDELIAAIQEAFAQGGKMLAFDFAGSSPSFTNNINVLRLEPVVVDAAALVGLAEKDIKRVGGKNVEAWVEWLPAGQSVIVTYDLPAELGGGEGLSYTVLTPTSQWVVTYTATDVATFQPSFELMMDSFRER